jgi:hypothetical protein
LYRYSLGKIEDTIAQLEEYATQCETKSETLPSTVRKSEALALPPTDGDHSRSGAASIAMLPGVALPEVPHAARVAAPAAAAPGAFQGQPVALPVAPVAFPGQPEAFPGVPVAAVLPGAAVPSSRAAPANRKRPASALEHQTSSDEQGRELHCDVIDDAFFASMLMAEVRLYELRM